MARPLSALLSQVLVAYTIEFDNEFERRMIDAGYRGANLSLTVWAGLMRFLADGAVPVRELAARAEVPEEGVRFQLGCLERWSFVVLESGSVRRDGWGSGRGIRSTWPVELTTKGRRAVEIWPSVLDEIERRWRARFGEDDIANLRESLADILGGKSLPLPGLLWQVLQAFTVEFDRESRVPLWLCANTIRVLGEQPTRTADIPRLTGASPETSGIGWQIKPFIVVGPDPNAKRGKVVRLTPLGLEAQRKYRELTAAIEKRWEERFGESQVRRVRDALLELFVPRMGERLLFAEGLIPAAGTMRAGVQAAALGRRMPAAAARQRMRDMVAQTEMFVRDPVNTLPHYPLWDMNRGFGP
jgi:DNA-binding MarR family transcriptional regulator